MNTSVEKKLTSRILSAASGIQHGFTTRAGDLDRETLPFLGEKIAVLDQVHGADIALIEQKVAKDLLRMPLGHRGSRLLGSYDAVVTNQRGIAVAVKTADCTPILLFDAKNQVVAAVHAGWRSAAAGILPKTLALMKAHFGTKGQDLLAGLGPAIDAENFEVGELVAAAFPQATHLFKNKPAFGGEKKYTFELKGFLREELLAFGVPEASIEILPYCTVRDAALFSSFRREKEMSTRQWNVIQLI